MKPPYRIILADDHAVLRDGIRQIVNGSRGLEVVGEAADGLELLKLVNREHPDMVILDISMPGLRGIEAAIELKKAHPGIEILFLSMHKKLEYLHRAIQTGARGYLLKEDTGSELIRAIDAIRRGETFLSPIILKEMPSDLIGVLSPDSGYGEDPLTERERQVLTLIASSKTNKEIAEALFISIHTVHNHRKNIRKKLNLRKTADLVKYAIQKGYFSETD